MMSAFYVQCVCVYGKHIEPQKWKTEKLEVDALLEQHVMTDALLKSRASIILDYLFPKSLLTEP